MQIKKHYLETVVPALMKEFNFKSIMQVPRIEKIVLNMTAGKEVINSKAIEEVLHELTLISSQKPFKQELENQMLLGKLREGMPMGGKVSTS